jgi:capsular exopolysaccharide synthesis family protein
MSQTHIVPHDDERPILVPSEVRKDPAGAGGAVLAPLDLMPYIMTFLRRGKLLIGMTVVGASAALALCFIETPIYRVHSSVELDAINEISLGNRDISALENGSLTDAYMQTQAMVLRGDTALRRALKKSPPVDPKAKGSFLSSALHSLKKKLGLSKAASAEITPDQIRANLTVRNIPMTRVIEVSYDGPDNNRAAAFVNTLINEYLDLNIERRLDSTHQTEKWLMAYLTPLKQNLEQSGRTLESYAHDSGLIGTNATETPAQAKLRDLQTELTKAHADRVSKEAIYETFANGPRDDVSTVNNPNPLREYQTKLSDLKAQYAQAIATLTPKHFRVQRLEAQIREMEQLIDQERVKTLELMRADYLAALRRETLLTNSVREQVMLAADQAGKRVHYDMLRQELETDQKVYDNVLEKAKESAVLGVTRPSNVHIIDEARPAPKPFKPNLPLYISLGSLSGFSLGLVWVAFGEFREMHLIAPGILPEVAQIRELAVVPSTSLDHGTDKNSRLLGAHKAKDLSLLAAPADSFLFSESFHAAVASIVRSQSNGTQLRVLTITSAMSGDGKTTVVTNLGLALASIRRRVVLIEGDLRHPKLSKNFDIANSWGLSDILQSTNRIEDMPFEALVKPTEVPGLFVVPSGPSAANVSSLLHSPRMGALIAALKKHASLILIDSPPLLAVSDARILASSSDAVIMVVRAHKTERETFLAAAQQLVDDQTLVLGAILNGWDPRRARGTRDPFQYQYSYRS